MQPIGASYSMISVLAIAIPALLALLVNVACGVGAVYMAKGRNLKPVPAFFAGFIGGLLTVLILAMFPKED